MKVLGIFIFCAGVFFLFYCLYKEFQEIRLLKITLFEILGKKEIKSVDDLVKIKNYLQNKISFNSHLKTVSRPLLRHTASDILTSNYGFCGENARVAIKLLQLGGVKANRIYLYGEQWQHVVVENKWDNSWFLFDGHYDEKTQLFDNQVATIYSYQIEKYPNDYDENTYINFCRIKLFHNVKVLMFLSKLRLPSFVIYFFESPYLIKSCLGILNIFIGILMYFFF